MSLARSGSVGTWGTQAASARLRFPLCLVGTIVHTPPAVECRLTTYCSAR